MCAELKLMTFTEMCVYKKASVINSNVSKLKILHYRRHKLHHHHHHHKQHKVRLHIQSFEFNTTRSYTRVGGVFFKELVSFSIEGTLTIVVDIVVIKCITITIIISSSNNNINNNSKYIYMSSLCF